ncbi:MAG: hypothetical protein GY745_11155, partial [Actinomycetia bacterium]|nr:hypothetical protein [Actinomycetes bacterium]
MIALLGALVLAASLFVTAPVAAENSAAPACTPATVGSLAITVNGVPVSHLEAVTVSAGSTVAASWDPASCDGSLTIAVHDGGGGLFDPSALQPLLTHGTSSSGSVAVTVPATSPLCHVQVDLVTGGALPMVGPGHGYYSFGQSSPRLIGATRGEVGCVVADTTPETTVPSTSGHVPDDTTPDDTTPDDTTPADT